MEEIDINVYKDEKKQISRHERLYMKGKEKENTLRKKSEEYRQKQLKTHPFKPKTNRS